MNFQSVSLPDSTMLSDLQGKPATNWTNISERAVSLLNVLDAVSGRNRTTNNNRHLTGKDTVDMGMSYDFHYASVSKLLEAKDADGVFDAIDYDTTVASDLDREDFIFRILDVGNKSLFNEKEKKVSEAVGAYMGDCDVTIVSKAMLERAIGILVDLDKKVMSMPYDEELNDGEYYVAGVANRTCNDLSRHGYVEDYSEPIPPDEPYLEFLKNYSFYGPSKEYVDIVREVYKVYGLREYHYRYPWRCSAEEGESVGSYWVQSVLREVLRKVEKMGEDEIMVMMWG